MNQNGTSVMGQNFSILKAIIFITMYSEWDVNGEPVCSGMICRQRCSCKSVEERKEGGKKGGKKGRKGGR